MTILDSNADQDIMRLWGLIGELSEELSRNRALSVTLYGQVGNLKNQANHSRTGFVLRRFNLDKAKDVYESELERMNAAVTAENQSLQYDNKQLGALIKEYEQTLDTLMSTFRNRARDVQERELSLIREYELKLLDREEENAAQELSSSTSLSESLARLSHALRQLIRIFEGEDQEQPMTLDAEEDREPWTATAAAQHALERECELARLQKENKELKWMLDMIGYNGGEASTTRPIFEQARTSISHSSRSSGNEHILPEGVLGPVRPFDVYKTAQGG